ncbi:MAG: cell wall hydrolase [Rhodospirillales bacterium]
MRRRVRGLSLPALMFLLCQAGNATAADDGAVWLPAEADGETSVLEADSVVVEESDTTSVDVATEGVYAEEAEAGTASGAGLQSGVASCLAADDREAIGRIAYAEAGNQGEEGIAAVIYTILNRVSSGQFQSTIQGVIDAPNQFEPATRAGGWRYLPPLTLSQRIQYETILKLILASRLPDPTNGALFFQNARIVAARAAAGSGSSYLVDFGGTPPIAEIRDHRFYDARAAVNLAAGRLRRSSERYPEVSSADLAYDSGDGYGREAAYWTTEEPTADNAAAESSWARDEASTVPVEEEAPGSDEPSS